ncbi:signal recognition particle receptor beta subunit, putative [Bodo saltans]|uniref:Signal recognition particle receptor subunit beta n=1 Tax=Bodo saltans TaxID=75058 RepID=A0A0S4IVW0_BODSA|nr:signal recognition particle receptor beta subunit, putative [Bodo saltans]|eukprot:CUG22145.1 signal recognition particle receptor beta subunit, putative [Bodo saltans]
MSDILVAVVGGLLVLGTLWAILSFLNGRGRNGVSAGIVFSKPTRSNAAMLIGLCGSGKTSLFVRLTTAAATQDDGTAAILPETNTSMQPNKGVYRSDTTGSNHTIVDYPGHRRLRGDGLYATLQESKRLVVVVDSITIQDVHTDGAQAVADLLYDVLQSNAFDGVESVLFACNKRDDVTSFSAKAVRRLLETEITRQITTRSAAVGSIEKVTSAAGQVAKGTKRGGGGTPSDRSDECVLVAQANGKFSFDALRVPVQFVDVSAVGDDTYNFEGVKTFVESGLSQ